jgi:hypothetical protein
MLSNPLLSQYASCHKFVRIQDIITGATCSVPSSLPYYCTFLAFRFWSLKLASTQGADGTVKNCLLLAIQNSVSVGSELGWMIQAPRFQKGGARVLSGGWKHALERKLYVSR